MECRVMHLINQLCATEVRSFFKCFKQRPLTEKLLCRWWSLTAEHRCEREISVGALNTEMEAIKHSVKSYRIQHTHSAL